MAIRKSMGGRVALRPTPSIIGLLLLLTAGARLLLAALSHPERIPGWAAALSRVPLAVAVGFVMAGLALVLAARGPASTRGRRLVHALGALTAVSGVAAIASASGALSVSSALALVLSGLALVLLDGAPLTAQALALGVELVCLEVLLGHAYGVGGWAVLPLEPMSPLVLCGFVALGVGLLVVRPGTGLLRRFGDDRAGTFLGRRLTLGAVAVPALLGWLVLVGERRAGYGAPALLLWFANALMLVFTALVWLSARALNRMEAQRSRAERRLRAQHTVTRTLAQSSMLREAAPHILEAIGNTLGWEVGAIWMVDEAADALRCLETWQARDHAAGAFQAVSRASQFRRGVGLPGRVWQGRAPVWIRDVTRDSNFARAPVAAREGLRGAFAFAIQIDHEVIGVVEFFSDQIPRPERELLEMVSAVGSQIGQFVERTRAEEARRESEERYRRIVETANEGIWLLEASGRTVYANRRMAEMLGTEPQALEGRPVWDFVFPEDREALLGRLEGKGASPVPFDFRFRRQDGGEVLVLGSTSPLSDAEGRPAGLAGLFTDTTERRRALLALQQAHERFELAAAAVQGVIYEWDVKSDAVDRTRGLAELFGYRPEEVPPEMEWWRQAIHPDDRAHVRDRVAAALASGEAVSVEYRMRRRDGRYGHVWDRGVIVRDEGGRAVRVVGSVMDLTERKWAEEALRESEARFRSLSVCSPVGIFLTDTRGYCTYTNPRSQAICGYTFEQALGAGWAQFVDPADRERILAAWSEATGQGGHYSDEMRFRRPDGVVRWAHMRSAPLLSDGGGLVGFVGTVEDITERKELETELRQRASELAEADRRKDEFLAMLAHELRNPLAPISNAVEVMRLKGLPDPVVERGRAAIERQVRHLTRLVDDLLDVSRITRGMIELRKEPLEMASVVDQAIQTCQSLLDERGHQLAVSMAAGSLWLMGDRARVVQVLCNLLNNAAKYSEPGGRVSLSVEREADAIVVRITDTGKGIPEVMLSRIFDVFTQVDPSLDRSEGGLGIGLSVVKRLVEMHGGRVEATSAGPGRGSQFVVRLPLLPAPPLEAGPREGSSAGAGSADAGETAGLAEAEPATARRPEPAESPRRVLVVDDNADSAESLTEMLGLWGHQARMALDGTTALALAQSYQPDVVLLDIGLPGMDGYEVARRIRQQSDGDRPLLVALTGYGQEQDRQRSREAGFDVHLTKPVDTAHLQQLLSDLRIGVPSQS